MRLIMNPEQERSIIHLSEDFAELGLSGCECNNSPRLWREAPEELKDRCLVNCLTQQFQLILWQSALPMSQVQWP